MMPVRTRRLLLWVALPALILVLLYTVLGFFLVPRLVRSGIHDFVTRNYHREVSLGDVRFNPYSLRLDMRDFRLPDSDGQPMLSFRHLLVDLTIASVWRLGPDFQAIVLEDPFARVLLKPDGTLNWSELALPPSPEKPQEKSKPLRLFVNQLSVRGGNVAFDDRAHPSEFKTEIKPLTFELRNFSTVSQESGTYALTGMTEVGARFSWSGSLHATPLSSHGQFEVENLQAKTIWDYLRDSVQFELPSGAISLAGDYDFTTATTPLGLAVNVHTVALTDLGIRPKGKTEDYIRLKRLEVHETRADVAKHTVDVGNVHLTGGEVRVWAPGDGGTLANLMELMGPPTSPEAGTAVPPRSPDTSNSTPATGDSANAPWVISVPDIALDGLEIAGQDRHVSPGVSLQLSDLGMHIGGFTTARSAPVSVALSTKINRGAKLDVKADLSPDLAAMKARVELANLDLTAFQPYITKETDLTLNSGLLSAKLDAERAADGHLTVTGQVAASKLRTLDNELKRDFVKFESLQVTGMDYQSNPAESSKAASLHIHDVLARAPYARVIIESDQTTNLARVLRLPPKSDQGGSGAAPAATNKAHGSHGAANAAAADAASSGSAMAIAVDTITIKDGSANYADLWIQPHFAIGIQMLNGSIVGLSSKPDARAKVDLNGKVDRYAPIRIWGETNPLAATAFSDINMSFKGVELSSVTPYSGHFAGYKIEKGKLSADIDYKIDHRKLTATHKFVIDQLELGERVESPEAVKLPLKIAIALLKDRNGVIDLDLPVSGSLDDPQFSIGPLVWKAVVGLLEKIATAPFSWIGHLFGGSEQINYIDFQPGSAIVDPAAHGKLDTLVKALKEKEKLELDVPIVYAPDVDRPGLAMAHLNSRLLETRQHPAGGGEQPAVMDAPPPSDPALTDPAQRFRLLLALYRAELGKSAALPDSVKAAEAASRKKGEQPDFAAANADLEAALLQKNPVPDSELESLGRHRARAIQQVLLVDTGIDPSRVFVIGTSPKPSTEKDQVRVELALK